MGQVLLVRHGKKGNGKKGKGLDCGPKNLLSKRGEKEARGFAQTRQVPQDFFKNLKQVGGAEQSRSLFTAMLIAYGAGIDPLILKSDTRLGSEKLLFKLIPSMDSYKEAMEANDNIETKAFRQLLKPRQYAQLKKNIAKAILEAAALPDNTILGTHSPWLQLFFEFATGYQCDINAAELDWILIDVIDGRFKIVASLNI